MMWACIVTLTFTVAVATAFNADAHALIQFGVCHADVQLILDLVAHPSGSGVAASASQVKPALKHCVCYFAQLVFQAR